MTQDPIKEKTQRLFVAVELPESVRQLLSEWQTGLPGVRWTAPENLHLTVRFIGEVPQAKVPVIKAWLKTVSENAFSLQIKGLGYFDKHPQAVVWAGIVPSPELAALQQRVNDVLALHAGIKKDVGQFSPHITLGRVKQADRAALKAFTAKYGDVTTATFRVEFFTLFSSVLAPGGAVHSVEERYSLNDGLSTE